MQSQAPIAHARAPSRPGLHWAWLLAPLVASAASHGWWAPDEPRYAQVAREAWETGSPIVLHVCGKLYLNKPPLLYWISGLMGWASGWSEFWMRLPSLLATALTAALTARLALRWWGKEEAAWAPALYLTTAMTLWYGARLQIDALLGLCTTAALVVATEPASTARESNRRALAAGALTGLGALAKGPVAFVLVGLVLLAWRWLGGRASPSRGVSRAAWIGSLLLALLPILAWAAAVVALQPPGQRVSVARSLFFGQHLQRALEGTDHVHPPWYFLKVLPWMFLPWTLPALAGIGAAWSSWKRRPSPVDQGLLRAAAWLLVLFLFFSASTGKRDLYFVPALPAVALLAARWLCSSFTRAEERAPRWILAVAPALLLLLGLACSALGFFQERLPPEAPEALWRGPLTGLPLALGGWIALAALRRRDLARCASATAVGLALGVTLGALAVFPAVDPVKSPRELARIVAARPERPSAIPCQGVWPEGYAFYSDRPFVHGPFGSYPLSEREQFLGLIRDDEWEILPEETRSGLRILHTRAVGSRRIHLVGASPAR